MRKTAILLANLGTPASPSESDVRIYLQEFLGDRRVIDMPGYKWKPILHGIILRTRPKKSAALYKKIWTSAGSPIMVHSVNQQRMLQERLKDRGVKVLLGMNYGQPSITSKLAELKEWGVEKLIVLPLFPQYSSTTTASVFDHVCRVLKTWRSMPELCFVRDFPDNEYFIRLLSQRSIECTQKYGEPDALILSYHGIPQRYADEGDDYPKRCRKTTEAVKKQLPHLDIVESFQSKFGKEPWLLPSTGDILKQLAGQGKTHVQIMAPAFAADCLETLEELEDEHRSIFSKAGGKEYHYLPAANDDPLFIDCLVHIAEKYL
ncbi:ferrochelatase [Bacillus testis]|uniref:ferrochelatase n=1 Tax=Bacillus testis TaxID=1622072 RepID=UPI00067F6744|nr:ferrochelatase [Bacillus testis]